MKQKLFLFGIKILLIFPVSVQGTESIEGRWIPSTFGHTMYEFVDTELFAEAGLRYTYYCDDGNGCDSTYWNSLDTSDAIPNPNPYSVSSDGNTLSIDTFFGDISTYELGFRCEGQVVDFFYDEDDNWEGLHSTMFRVGFDSLDNECLETNPEDCLCTEQWDPVCGIDGNTYSNACFATCEYVVISYEGVCINQQVVTFTKEDSADWTLPENQDRITDSVWITRKHNQSLFNIAQETGYSVGSGSPLGTLWAGTSTADAQNEDFVSFVEMYGGNPQSLINDTISLHLPASGKYFDVVLLSYSGGNSGGGFSYSREEVYPTHLGAATIEGRWLWGYGFHPLASTMYELINGTMYTYYCIQDSGCDATDWDSLDTSDAIPNPDSYTFTNDTLTINDGPGAHVNFECNGNIAIFNDNTDSYWWRVGLDTSECEGLSLIHI